VQIRADRFRGSSELYVVYGSYLHADGDLLHYNYILCHCQVNIPIFSKETKEEGKEKEIIKYNICFHVCIIIRTYQNLSKKELCLILIFLKGMLSQH